MNLNTHTHTQHMYIYSISFRNHSNMLLCCSKNIINF